MVRLVLRLRMNFFCFLSWGRICNLIVLGMSRGWVVGPRCQRSWPCRRGIYPNEAKTKLRLYGWLA